MNIKEIDTFFLGLERKSKNGFTLLNVRQGDSRNNPKPFVVFLGHEDLSIADKILSRFTNIYETMDFIKKYLQDNPEVGYFYA